MGRSPDAFGATCWLPLPVTVVASNTHFQLFGDHTFSFDPVCVRSSYGTVLSTQDIYLTQCPRWFFVLERDELWCIINALTPVPGSP